MTTKENKVLNKKANLNSVARMDKNKLWNPIYDMQLWCCPKIPKCKERIIGDKSDKHIWNINTTESITKKNVHQNSTIKRS